MNDLDKIQRIVIAGAISVGIIGIVLTFSGVWALPGASNQRGLTINSSAGLADSQGGVVPQYSTPSLFEELLKNGSPSDAVSDELYLKVMGGSLSQLIELEQKSLSQTEGDKLQQQIIQVEVDKALNESSQPLDVPAPHVTITKDTSRTSKQAYLSSIATLKEPLAVIASFFSNTTAVSSKENLTQSAPTVLAAYDTALSQGATISVPADWAPLHFVTMYALEKQRVGLQTLYSSLESDPVMAIKGMQALQDGALEYMAASKASLQVLRKEGF